MKYFSYILFIFSILSSVSCDDNSVSFGKVEYYPSFLWKDSKITPVIKTFVFDFSLDAQNDSTSFVELQFVDNNGNPINTNIMQVYDGDHLLANNSILIFSNVRLKELTFSFSPESEIGKHQGYVKVVRHNLDRIDSQQLRPGDIVELFQWTLYFDKVMNPLARNIMWIILLTGVCLLIWFLIVRPSLYPHFGKFTKSILIKQNNVIVGQFNYAFKGSRKVVFYDRKIEQSVWNRIFVGEIKTYVNPLFKTKLTFSPKRGNATTFGVGYYINPNPIPRSGVATITNHTENITIILR